MADQAADRVVVQLEARTTNYLANMRNARRDFDGYMASMGSSAERMEKRVSSAGNRMSSLLGRAIAAIAVGAAVKEARLLADTWTSTGNKLAAAGVETEQLGARQAQLVDLARETRTEYGQTADIYARITRSTKELNTTDEQRLRLTELVNKAVKAGGATTAEQISTITQLGQALASGNLQGDELRSIRENAPLIARALAAEFDTTIGGLKKLGAEGEITSDRIVRAILNAGGTIDSQFSKTRATIGESFTALETEATQFIGNLDKAIGVTTGIAAFTNKVTEDFDLMSQAVIVAAAVMGGAVIGKMSIPLQQAAVSNANFVRSLIAGTTATQLQNQALRQAAMQVSLKAQAERDAARASVVATQERINQLRQEAAAYQQNIALAQQQRAAVAGIAAGRSAGGQFVSRTDQAAATGARDTATKAAIANRMALKRATDELAVAEARLAQQHATLSGALVRVSAAQMGVSAAIARSTLLANVGAVAMRGLSAAMAFFGGPIGLAITAVAGAIAYFTTEAAKAEAAGDNLQGTLDEMSQSAESTKRSTDDLAKGQRDGAAASSEAAAKGRDSASAYDAIGAAAANAAEYVKYLTAAQRQQRLEKLEGEVNDLRRAQTGSNPFTTNNRERVTNAQNRLLRAAGLPRSAAYDTSGALTQRAWDAARQQGASEDLKRAAQDYSNAVAVYNDNNERLKAGIAARDVLYKSIDDPTIERPNPSTTNLTTPTQSSSSGGGSGGSRGRSSREETREELEARRELFDLEQRLNQQRAAGAETLAQFTQDEIDRRRIVASLIDQQYSPEQAEQAAANYMTELRAAREVADQAKRNEDARKRAEDQKEEDARKAQTREEQLAFLREQELLHQREMARLAGDSERVKELDKILDRMQRIAALTQQGGLTPGQASTQVTNDQNQLDQAENMGKIKDQLFNPIHDALLEAFKGGDWQDTFASAIEENAAQGFSDALNKIYDFLANKIADMFKGAGSGGGSGGGGFNFGDIISSIGNFFKPGGGRAGGGLMKPGMVYNFEENGRERIMVGSTARVLPNRVESASSGGGGRGDINLSVVNATGVPAKATIEKDDQGNAQLRLEPLIDQGIQSAGRRGVLEKSRQMTPRPTRRS